MISVDDCRDDDGDMDTEKMLAAGCEIVYAFWPVEDDVLEFDVVIHESQKGTQYYYNSSGVSWVDGPFSSLKEAREHSQSVEYDCFGLAVKKKEV